MKIRTTAAIAAFAFSLVAAPAASQEADSAALAFQRNFVRASLATKTELVAEATAKGPAAFGPLYELALDFCLQGAELLRDDPSMISLAAAAAEGAAAAGHARSAQALWRVFMAYRDPKARVPVLKALGVLGKGDSQLAQNLNQYLATQNSVFKSGLAPDLATLSACIDTLAKLDDGSSFPVLFSAMIAGYPGTISQEASKALSSIRGDYKKYLVDVMRKNPPEEKLAAFKAGVANEAFNDAAVGELAEAALDISLGLYPTEPAQAAAIQDLRYSSVRELTKRRWSRATPLALKHFYRVQTDYGKGLVPKETFVEAVDCLGAMASSEAAQALALQLGLLNAEVEKSRSFDPAVVLTVVRALGSIGDKVAFDYLFFIGYLPYSEEIKAEAREALNRLKW